MSSSFNYSPIETMNSIKGRIRQMELHHAEWEKMPNNSQQSFEYMQTIILDDYRWYHGILITCMTLCNVWNDENANHLLKLVENTEKLIENKIRENKLRPIIQACISTSSSGAR
jgi:hypothetical protein